MWVATAATPCQPLDRRDYTMMPSEFEVIHQSNPEKLPDSQFAPGTLQYIAVGNEGRLLDPRRTPVRIVAIDEPSGHFVVEITDFEDKGARWEMPLEDVSRFQFQRKSTQANPTELLLYSETVKRLDRTLHIPCSPERSKETARKMLVVRQEVSEWLEAKSEFLTSDETLDFESRDGIPSLYRDCERLMKSRRLWIMETAFADQFVSNPHTGEVVKGHRIVLAEMGLVEYQGKIIRNPAIFDGDWAKSRRIDHILARLAFLREIFARTGNERPTLYRGFAMERGLEPPRNTTFVSATFNLDVAMSIFSGACDTRDGALFRQHVSADRLFMTYFETRQMNRQFREAEAILLFSDEKALF